MIRPGRAVVEDYLGETIAVAHIRREIAKAEQAAGLALIETRGCEANFRRWVERIAELNAMLAVQMDRRVRTNHGWAMKHDERRRSER